MSQLFNAAASQQNFQDTRSLQEYALNPLTPEQLVFGSSFPSANHPAPVGDVRFHAPAPQRQRLTREEANQKAFAFNKAWQEQRASVIDMNTDPNEVDGSCQHFPRGYTLDSKARKTLAAWSKNPLAFGYDPR